MALTQIPIELSSTPSIVDGGNATAITINSSEEVTFAAKVTAIGTSVFTNLDISGNVDVDGTTNLDVVDIDGAVNMATTLLVTGAATFNNSVTATSLIASNGVLELDDNGSHNGIINSPASLFVNIDSDNGATNENFIIAKDRASTSGGTEIVRVNEGGITTFTKSGGGNIRIAETASRYVEIMGYAEASANGSTMAFSTIQTGTSTSTERMRIDSSGHVLVGKTTTALGTAGLAFGGAGFASLTRSGATALNINRLTNDGDWITAYKAGTALGHIGTYGGTAYIGSVDSGIMFNGVDIEPTSGEQARADNAIDLGSANFRFRDIVLGGGVFMGGTASANHLHDYEEGTWTPVIAAASGNTVTGTTVNQAVYTKIGRHVTIHTYISAINMALMTSGSYVQLQGLPFAASAYADLQFIYHRGGNTFVGGYIQSGTSYMYFCDIDGTEIQQSGNALLTAFIATASYITAA